MRGACLLVLSLLVFGSQAALAEDWDMHLTVDNQFDAYFGTATTTNFYAGRGTDWPTTYHYTAPGRGAGDFLYVATASDQSVAQGFIGVFTNTTRGVTVETGSDVWEVFPAGAYAATNPFGAHNWPANLLPTQAQVDTAIAYATANDLWVPPDTDDAHVNGVSPWGSRPDIPNSAKWIWHNKDKASFSSPFEPGVNHDEFLVFRISGTGVPEPASAALLLPAISLASLRCRSASASRP